MPAPQAKEPAKSKGLRVVKPGAGTHGSAAVKDASARSLVSLPAGKNNLPRELSSFVGRQGDAAAVTDLAVASPLVTITGPSGIGKTRLVLHVAAQVAPSRPDGAWLVELALLPTTDDPAVVADALATVLEVRIEPGRSAVEAVVAATGESSRLIVFDNCEHVRGATASVVASLLTACPNLSVLATSQQPLGVPGEQVWPLGPLSLPGPDQMGAGSDAVALFYARAKSVQPAFVATPEGAEAVAEICRRLDGIPLAIELAAARTAVLSPIEIAENLDQRFELLTRVGSTVTPRHQTLQSALDWSYDLLTSGERALLRRMSVFAGGCGLSEVRQICAGDDVGAREIVDLLAALVSKSLVVADTSRARARYRLLETIRAYSRERLLESGEADEIAKRHAEWFVGFAERNWHQVVVADQRGGGDALEMEHDNIRVALGWLLDNGKATVALRLGSSLTPFWKARGHFRDGREWLERALVAAGKRAPSAMRGRTLWGIGMLAMMQGDLERANSALEESLAIARNHEHQRPALEALNLLAFVSIFTANPLTALPLLEESVAMARRGDDDAFLINALALCGRALLFTGDTVEAELAFEECRQIGAKIGDGDESAGLMGLGWVALSRGQHTRAEEILSQALPFVRDDDDRFETALVLSFLGELAWQRGEIDAAQAVFEEGLVLARSMGAPFPTARCLTGLALMADSLGQHDSANRLIDQAVDSARRSRFSHLLTRCLHGRADIHLTQGALDEAVVCCEEALALATDGGDKAGVAGSLTRLGAVDRERGNYSAAVNRYLEALDLNVQTGDTGGVADTLDAIAGLALVQDRASHALHLLAGADGLRTAHGSFRRPSWQGKHEADMELLRSLLPAGEIEEGWAQGAAMSVADAVSLASRSRGGRRRPEKGAQALTAAERQAVDLATAGLSNVEIAERMFVSPRTVQGHLSRSFGKLGVKSRRELRAEYAKTSV